ncbi:MAG: hypothetical protein P4M05_27860 [Bradyrhizobium sp.]|nr:hypothetical protein [Bradyrhizobium sp.]
MIFARFLSRISAVLVAAIINATCISPSFSQDNPGARLGDAVGNILGGIIGESLGIGSYKLSPQFRKNVAPYITDMAAFDAFMAKYQNKTDLTEKDGVDMIIQLGILKNRPDWITKEGMGKIEKYYPGITKKKAMNGAYGIKYASVVYRQGDANEDYNVAVALTYPIVFMAAPVPVLAKAVVTLGLFGIMLYEAAKLVNHDGQVAWQAAQNDVCASPEISCTAAPQPKATPTDTTVGVGEGNGRWQCNAQCNVQAIDVSQSCPDRVYGTSRGPSEELACREAKRVATQSTPRGCYPRHCYCKECTK